MALALPASWESYSSSSSDDDEVEPGLSPQKLQEIAASIEKLLHTGQEPRSLDPDVVDVAPRDNADDASPPAMTRLQQAALKKKLAMERRQQQQQQQAQVSIIKCCGQVPFDFCVLSGGLPI